MRGYMHVALVFESPPSFVPCEFVLSVLSSVLRLFRFTSFSFAADMHADAFGFLVLLDAQQVLAYGRMVVLVPQELRVIFLSLFSCGYNYMPFFLCSTCINTCDGVSDLLIDW